MKTHFVLILFALILASATAFATANVTTNAPVANEILYGGRSYTIDFNIITDDANGILAPVATQMSLYYSTIAGSRSYLIYTDTNVMDGTGIKCADYNFVNTTDCNYTWALPAAPTLAIGTYYVDYNMTYPSSLTTQLGKTASSSAFQVQQPMSSTMTSMIALALFIAACAIAVFAVMGLGKGMEIQQFVMMIIVVLVMLVIAWTLYSVVIVP